jgi:hypothetical protein
MMLYRMQDGLVPPLQPEEASGIITGSEQILKEYAKKASLTAKDIVSLIQDVLHNPDFNADDVDTDMLKRFADSIDSGDSTEDPKRGAIPSTSSAIAFETEIRRYISYRIGYRMRYRMQYRMRYRIRHCIRHCVRHRTFIRYRMRY